MCNKKIGLWLFVLLSIGFVCGCIDQEPDTTIRVEDYKETIRVACIGDSITSGHGIKYPLQDAYPAQLGKKLGHLWEVRNFGLSGSTLLKKTPSTYWGQAMFEEAVAFNPDVVIIMLGTNDATDEVWQERKDEFAGDYEDMIDQFTALEAKPKIRICYPVPIYPGASWAKHEERRLNLENEVIPLIKKVAERKNVPVIDLYESLSGKPKLFPDTVHPNAEGATLVAEAVYNSLVGKVEK